MKQYYLTIGWSYCFPIPFARFRGVELGVRLAQLVQRALAAQARRRAAPPTHRYCWTYKRDNSKAGRGAGRHVAASVGQYQ